MEFKDKIALVTGASRGIGRAIADTLASGGATLIITATSNAIEQVASEIKEKYNVEVTSFYGDISKEEVVKELFGMIDKKYGKLHICVNNAGITRDGLSMRMGMDDFDAVINVNLRSSFMVSKEAALIMMKERYGKIVNMSSIVGVRGNAGQVNYAASKAGLIAMTKTMAVELAKRNITVNAIAPGFIDTDMTKAISDKAKEEFMKLIPMEKAGQAQDIADAVAFFSSDKSKYITGQTLIVDGGLLLR